MPDEEKPIEGGRRRRDATSYVVMRRPRPMIVGRASQADLDAEAYARFVGSWGNFSGHIGRRWEQLAGDWASAQVGRALMEGDTASLLTHVEELDRNEALHREVERVGVSCPDALFCGRDAAGSVLVQPVDYKVSLDTASFDQVEATRIVDLATRGGDFTVAAISQAIARVAGTAFNGVRAPRETLLEQLAGGAVQPVDGLFVSPDTAFNRVHLRSRENQRRQRPLRPADVLLVALSPEQFFAGTPGWEEGQRLMQADRVRADLPGDLGMAERYARLGAGVVGALQTIHSPLFGPSATPDTPSELQSLLVAHPTSLAVLTILLERRSERLELLRRRDKLLHFPFRMPALLEALGPFSAGAGEGAWPSSALREGIATLHQAHRTRVEQASERLLAERRSDRVVLEALEADWSTFKRTARSDLERWAEATRARRLAAPE
ncbi:MAG: hypothetical protein ACR2JY_19885 [Chloroflexota bacterium]